MRLLALLALLTFAALPAWAQTSPKGCPAGNVPCSAIQQFTPTGDATISAGTVSSNAVLGSNGANLSALIVNASASIDAFVTFGDNTAVATTTVSATNYLVPAGRSIAALIGSSTYIAAITASSTAALTVYTGTGIPTLTWASNKASASSIPLAATSAPYCGTGSAGAIAACTAVMVLPNGATATTQAQNDVTNKPATTSFVATAVTAINALTPFAGAMGVQRAAASFSDFGSVP